jgi:quercetin dioxygenase-like cupin family protein
MTYSVPEGSVDLEYAKKGGVYVPNKSGVTTWFSGDICSARLTGQQTGGQIGLVEATVPPGGGPAPHVHERTDETFYVVNGELEFLVGDTTFTASAGDVVFLPRGTVHASATRASSPPGSCSSTRRVVRRACSWRAATSRSPASRCSPGDLSVLTSAWSDCWPGMTPACRRSSRPAHEAPPDPGAPDRTSAGRCRSRGAPPHTYRLRLSNGGTLTARSVVITTGVTEPRPVSVNDRG